MHETLPTLKRSQVRMPPSTVPTTGNVKLVAPSELPSHRRCVVRRDPCVPIKDQFGCQASMCHLDVFTDTRIIYATLWRTGAKPHTRSTNKVLVRKREREGEEEEKDKKQEVEKDTMYTKKAELTVHWRQWKGRDDALT